MARLATSLPPRPRPPPPTSDTADIRHLRPPSALPSAATPGILRLIAELLRASSSRYVLFPRCQTMKTRMTPAHIVMPTIRLENSATCQTSTHAVGYPLAGSGGVRHVVGLASDEAGGTLTRRSICQWTLAAWLAPLHPPVPEVICSGWRKKISRRRASRRRQGGTGRESNTGPGY